MSLTLNDLQGELREYYGRIEEVLSGMDAVLARLDARVSRLETLSSGSMPTPHPNTPSSLEQRVARLEGQLAALVESLYEPGSGDDSSSGGIYVGR